MGQFSRIALTTLALASCKPTVPPQWITQIEPEFAGANCADGGLVIHEGPDIDADGVLDEGERERASYQCAGELPDEYDGLFLGSIVVRTADDVDALAQYDGLTGHLSIVGPQLGAVTIPGLRAIGGAVRVGSRDETTVLSSASFPDLAWAGGGVELTQNPSLTEFSAPLLEAQGDLVSIRLVDNPLLTDLSSLDGLTAIGDLEITGEQATSVTLNSIAAATGTLLLQPSGDDMQVSLPAATVLGDVLIEGESALTSFSAPLAETVLGSLVVADAPQLVELSTASVRTIGGNFDLLHADGLSAADFPVLEQVDLRIKIQDNHVQTLDFPLLSSVGEGFWVSRNDALHSVDLSSLILVGNWPVLPFAIEANPVLTDLVLSPDELLVDGWMVVASNPMLPSLDPFMNVSGVTGDLTLKNNTLISVCDSQALVDSIGTDNIGTAFDGVAFNEHVGVIDLGGEVCP